MPRDSSEKARGAELDYKPDAPGSEATSFGSVAQRGAAREAEDRFLAAVQARIDAGRKPGFARIGDLLPLLLDEARQRLAAAEARAAAVTDGALEGLIRDEQLDDSREIDVYADALDQLAQVQP